VGNSSRSDPRWLVAALLVWAAAVTVLHFLITPGWQAVWRGLRDLMFGPGGSA